MAALRAGEFPDFGAIFMSNGRTRRECLERQLFGLPLQFADFVKNVRAGMILFLFEHEKRELHGVFEAISDGGLNIVPHAYHSSGRAFPSQVQIRVLFNCDPLLENCFRDAIEENYYAASKFRFGLSREQVYRLLSLFDVRKFGPQESLKQENVQRRHSRSPDRESLSVEPGNQTMAQKTSQKFQPPDAQISSYKSGNTSPGCELGQQQEKIEQIDSPESHSMDLGDYIPLCSPEDQNEHEGDLDHKIWLKGLCSDIAETRVSVFSRLKLSLQSTTKRENDNFKTLEQTESVEKVMQNLQLKHDNWVKMRKKGDTGTFQDIDNPVRQRSNVFSRLSFTSEAIGRRNIRTNNSHSHQTLEGLSKSNKKRKHGASSITGLGNSQHIGMTFQENATLETPVAKATNYSKNGTYGWNRTLSISPSKCMSREIGRMVNNSVWQGRSALSLLSFTSAATAQNSRIHNCDKPMEDVSKEKKERKHVDQRKNMSVKVNKPENRLEIAEAPVAEEAFKIENGCSVSCAKRIVETSVTLEEKKLRDIDDATGVLQEISAPKFLITYKRKRGISAPHFVGEPAQENNSDQEEIQQ